jgi:hypothetical protein
MAQESHKPVFAEVEEAMAEIRAGRMVVVVDDEDRENEGDLTLAAEFVTPEAINFMAKFGRGLICLTLTGEYVAVRDGVYGDDRGARGCDDGDFGCGPGAYDSRGD